MKFDFVIGNPPYQDETLGDNKGFAPPVYDKFLTEGYKVGTRVMMIHPARFLFNAGTTPKAWNKQMLNDPHLIVKQYEPDCTKLFSNTDIKGGIVITYHDETQNFGAIGTFTPYEKLNSVMHRVQTSIGFQSFSRIVITRTAYRLTDVMHKEHPEALGMLSNGHPYDMSTNILELLPQIFHSKKPNDSHEYIQIYGREKQERVFKYIRRDYVNDVVNLDKYKVFLPKANGGGSFGETLTLGIIAPPMVGATETFLSIGIFDNEMEANNTEKYIKTKFARALLGALKVTQDITPEKWEYVPLQDFTPNSDIDWSQSIAQIDQQLYRKYGLTEEEISFIETHVKEMT